MSPAGTDKSGKTYILFKYLFIDQKDKERERARLSRDGEGRAPHPPTPSREGEDRTTGGGWGVEGGLGGLCALRRHGWGWGLGGFRALRRHGWGWGVGGAPFAVTAELRSLSLFIYLVHE